MLRTIIAASLVAASTPVVAQTSDTDGMAPPATTDSGDCR
jgi:hypothetical protein